VKVVKRPEEPAAGDGGAQRPGTSGTPGSAAVAGSVVEEPWSPLDGKPPGRVELEIQVKAEGEAEPRVYAVAVPVLAQVAP